jgi:hypothetical protein
LKQYAAEDLHLPDQPEEEDHDAYDDEDDDDAAADWRVVGAKRKYKVKEEEKFLIHSFLKRTTFIYELNFFSSFRLLKHCSHQQQSEVENQNPHVRTLQPPVVKQMTSKLYMKVGFFR